MKSKEHSVTRLLAALPLPLQLLLVCFVLLSFWFTPHPQPFSEHRKIRPNLVTGSLFICVLSQCLIFVKGSACCQVLSLHKPPQANYGPQAQQQTRLIIFPLCKGMCISRYR